MTPNELGWIAHNTAAYAASQIGENAVVIVMVADNKRPHSMHHVMYHGSCLEVRGLLAQCSDIVKEKFNGNNRVKEGNHGAGTPDAVQDSGPREGHGGSGPAV